MAEIGTPENPEIIDPSLPPPKPRLSSRWTVARAIFIGLVSISLPAIGVGMIFAWLFDTAINYGGLLPWLALVLMALPTFLLSVIAVLANVVMWPLLILTLFGKINSFSLNDPRVTRFARFGAFRR